MTADYFSMTGHDIWHRTDKTVHQLRNLHTGEIVVCESIAPKFQAVIMPSGGTKPHKTKAPKTRKTKKKTPDCLKKYKKKKHTGIIYTRSGKFQAGFWDGKTNVNLGTYGTLPEAIEIREAAVQKAKSGKRDQDEKTFAEIDKPTSEQESKHVKVTGGMQMGDIDKAVV